MQKADAPALANLVEKVSIVEGTVARLTNFGAFVNPCRWFGSLEPHLSLSSINQAMSWT